MSLGRIEANSASSQGWHAAICPRLAVLWIRALPRSSKRKCLTAFVKYTELRSSPISPEHDSGFARRVQRTASLRDPPGHPAVPRPGPSCHLAGHIQRPAASQFT